MKDLYEEVLAEFIRRPGEVRTVVMLTDRDNQTWSVEHLNGHFVDVYNVTPVQLH